MYMARRLLLISNSKTYGGGYLDHCIDEISNFLGDIKKILFFPYALNDLEDYTKVVDDRFQNIGVNVTSIHSQPHKNKAIQEAKALFIGGGNTFRLLNSLYQNNLLKVISDRVAQGAPYIGSSAGSNVACPTIKTTNDMPIVYPPAFNALNLVPFNINPHYLDPDPDSKHQGETREQRIKEFHELNDQVVVGLREGALLRVEGDKVFLKGTNGAVVFAKNQLPQEYQSGQRLDFLLEL
jgi:dipeptidase E